jgi:hypothetical protein
MSKTGAPTLSPVSVLLLSPGLPGVLSPATAITMADSSGGWLHHMRVEGSKRQHRHEQNNETKNYGD